MMGEGCFEQGVVSRETLQPIAWEVLGLARVAREKIDHERTLANVGVRLHSFNESINDRASELASELDNAQCALSQFSMHDLLAGFSPDMPLLARLITPLATRTRKLMGNARTPSIPKNYSNFARDALATLLPAVFVRRTSLCVRWECAPHPLADLLRSLPALKSWSPLDGKFSVGTTELRAAHPGLRSLLECHAAESSGLVQRTGQGAPGSRSKAAIRFTFESAPLVRLLSM
jgi:hypothetical protein